MSNNPIEMLRGLSGNDDSVKDLFVSKLRRNSILTWIEKLEDVNKYKEILRDSSISSTLHIESGIVRVDPSGRYLSHRFVPHVKNGFSFVELSVILRHYVLSFEDEYGVVLLSDNDISSLKNIVYKYNRTVHGKIDMTDKKKLIHIDQSAEVLYYLITSKVIFKAEINGWCTLTFVNNNNSRNEYCTIFTEEEISVLEKVNRSLGKQ